MEINIFLFLLYSYELRRLPRRIVKEERSSLVRAEQYDRNQLATFHSRSCLVLAPFHQNWTIWAEGNCNAEFARSARFLVKRRTRPLPKCVSSLELSKLKSSDSQVGFQRSTTTWLEILPGSNHLPEVTRLIPSVLSSESLTGLYLPKLPSLLELNWDKEKLLLSPPWCVGWLFLFGCHLRSWFEQGVCQRRLWGVALATLWKRRLCTGCSRQRETPGSVPSRIRRLRPSRPSEILTTPSFTNPDSQYFEDYTKTPGEWFVGKLTTLKKTCMWCSLKTTFYSNT